MPVTVAQLRKPKSSNYVKLKQALERAAVACGPDVGRVHWGLALAI
jgi:hypothetical protein